MKRLLTITAIIEAPTGLLLIVVPAMVATFLLGAEISGAGLPPARIAGVALFSLSVACWIARSDVQSRAARGLVGAMAFYNLGTVVILGVVGIWSQPAGAVLWPVVFLHAVMTVWCVACLRRGPETA